MSSVNISRAVENIKSGTTAYSPIVEVIVNAIEAIEDKKEKNGEIIIYVKRSAQDEINGQLPEVEHFDIIDNGIGFTDENTKSFDTLYSDHKIEKGGKGFGRFVCIKYFKDFKVDSVYEEKGEYKRRVFYMGKKDDIIVKGKIQSSDSKNTGSRISLISAKSGRFPDKKIQTIAKNLVEKLLPYFISEDYTCPNIIISEEDGSEPIVLNDSVNNELSDVISEIKIKDSSFKIKAKKIEHNFDVRIFKFYFPKSQKSKVSLVADNREVTDTALHNHIPEFYDEFYDKIKEGKVFKEKNYIIKAYVFGNYLNQNVSYERGGFDFNKDVDLIHGISQIQIEKMASEIAQNAVGKKIIARQEKKKKRVTDYVVEQAPWHNEFLEELDLSTIPFNPTDEDIELKLQKEKFNREIKIKHEVKKILAENKLEDIKSNVTETLKRISRSGRNDLVHYIALRRNILDIFGKSLERNPDGSYSSEALVHDIIFPRKKDSLTISFDNHNLWIVDERLNFTHYISSDLPLNGGNSERTDLLVYNNRVLFRGDNDPSNPVTIFEFKKPQRDDFCNPSSKEDPIQQIIRYVNNIKAGKYKTPEGLRILVGDNTPFFGYVVCDLTAKVEKWLEFEKDFKPMPDKLGWFRWRENINLYIEVLSWDKLVKDANMRNKIFFHKLGI